MQSNKQEASSSDLPLDGPRQHEEEEEAVAAGDIL